MQMLACCTSSGAGSTNDGADKNRRSWGEMNFSLNNSY